MMRDWKYSDAEAQFESLFEQALREGPQRIIGAAEPVIVISDAEYQKLVSAEPPPQREYADPTASRARSSRSRGA